MGQTRWPPRLSPLTCGHAVQHAREYAPLKMRAALVPVISFSSRFSFIVIILGLVVFNTMPAIFWVGILLVALSAVFSIITLPVEYNASDRALAWLRSSRTLSEAQVEQARVPLRWAARTYLVAALSAIATLLYFISAARRN